jgi:putative tricarboxylic transport membrane protein
MGVRPLESGALRLSSDRFAGIILVVLGVLVALEARNFTVGFVTDPLGPKVFPLVAAGLFVAGGGSLILRSGDVYAWPGMRLRLRLIVATVCLFAYGMLLSTLGFFLTTTAEVAVFALLLGGRPLVSVATAASISGALYVLFYYVLNIALPIGSLFLRGGS